MITVCARRYGVEAINGHVHSQSLVNECLIAERKLIKEMIKQAEDVNLLLPQFRTQAPANGLHGFDCMHAVINVSCSYPLVLGSLRMPLQRQSEATS